MDEQQDKEAAALARLHAHMATGSLLEIVLRGHLWIESEIIGGVTDQFPFPDEIDVARLTFPTKLSLAAAHGLIPSDGKPVYLKLNSLRNKIAHNLDAEVTASDLDTLVNSFSSTQRAVYDDLPVTEHPSADWQWSLRACVLMLYHHVVAGRQFLRIREAAIGPLSREIARLATLASGLPSLEQPPGQAASS